MISAPSNIAIPPLPGTPKAKVGSKAPDFHLTAADLSITSAMITPATAADFTFRTSGTFATRHSRRPVPSGFTAGGSVTATGATDSSISWFSLFLISK